MNIFEWQKDLYQFINIENNKKFKLSDRLVKRLENDADINGQNISEFINEALHNFLPTKHRLLEYENIGKAIGDKIAYLISEEEIKQLKKVFIDKNVEITRDELLELIAAKLYAGMVL